MRKYIEKQNRETGTKVWVKGTSEENLGHIFSRTPDIKCPISDNALYHDWILLKMCQ